MADIFLSGNVRTNLMAMQKIGRDMGTVEERLATGLKVNSALDDPANYFTSEGLKMRAKDLENIMDAMGQSIQTLKAADSAVETMTDLIETARAKANQALQTRDGFQRDEYLQQYNELLEQIGKVAEDAGYNGKNLLGGAGNNMSVYFNEDFTNRIKVESVDYTDISQSPLFLTAKQQLVPAAAPQAAFSFAAGGAAQSTTLVSATTTPFAAGLLEDDVITITGGTTNQTSTFRIDDDMTIADFMNELNNAFPNVKAELVDLGATVEIRFQSAEPVTITHTPVATGVAANLALGTGAYPSGPTTESDWSSDAQIRADINIIREALQEIQSQAGRFATDLTTIQARQEFATSMTNHLEEGSGKLVLADINEESANLLTLQTRQQLSQTALSLTTQSEQSVLRLFG